jgi:hypothetical protein
MAPDHGDPKDEPKTENLPPLIADLKRAWENHDRTVVSSVKRLGEIYGKHFPAPDEKKR